MDEVLRKESQSMKWMGIFPVGVFRRGGEGFPGESLMGGNFPGGEFS